MTRPLLLALFSVTSLWTAAGLAHAKCAHEPTAGGDPGIAAATALQIELCRASPRRGVTLVRAQGATFDVELGVWTFALDRVRLETVSAASPRGEQASEFKQRSDAIFAINGGFFDFGPQHELRPVGLFIEKGRIKKPLTRVLSGTLLIDGRRVELLDTGSVVTTLGYTSGLQSKPLLVDPGNRLGMRSNDGVRVQRSAVCMADAKHISFFYAGGNGLSLYELAVLLQAPKSAGGFACDVALNLDGGPSTQVAATVDGAPFVRLGQNVVNAIVVLGAP